MVSELPEGWSWVVIDENENLQALQTEVERQVRENRRQRAEEQE